MKVLATTKLNYYELILTEDCNLRCSYCFDDYFCQRKGDNTIMSEDMIQPIINFIEKTRDKERDIINISLFGGEPMMNYKFIQKFIKELEETKTFNVRYHINTNGTMLNKDAIEFFIKYNVHVVLSIDGMVDTHNKNRKTADAKDSWHMTMKHVPYLLAQYNSYRGNTKLNVIMVVDENNYEDFTKNFMFLRSLGLDVNSLFNTDHELTDKFIESIIEQYEKLFYQQGVRPFPVEYDRRILQKIENGQKSNTYCFTPDRAVTITTSGKLAFCHQLVPKMQVTDNKYENYYGDIFDGFVNEEFIKIIENRTNFSEFSKDKKCKDCIANFWCAGGCVASHWFQKNEFETLNENLCKLNQAFTKLALKYHSGE